MMCGCGGGEEGEGRLWSMLICSEPSGVSICEAAAVRLSSGPVLLRALCQWKAEVAQKTKESIVRDFFGLRRSM